MRIAIILGIRPEIIKMAPVTRECQKRELGYFVLHTGQHYSYEMDRIFFDDLELPRPTHNLETGSGSHADQTGRIMSGIEKILMKIKPDVILVQGDTNTVLAGALAASKMQIKVGHVEAGLRSYDRSMPEEINRVVVDHISDYLFAPTDLAKSNLLKEGIREDKILVTGNTIVDSVNQNYKIAERKSKALGRLGLESRKYFLVTAHRAENVDDRNRLGGILGALEAIMSEFSMPVIFPIHPRTKKMVNNFGFGFDGIKAIDPVGFLEFLQLEANARLVLTDSGGVQEETCILGVPCVTLRENTERQETVEVASNLLAGTNSERILKSAKKMMDVSYKWKNPFGDGQASQRIVSSFT